MRKSQLIFVGLFLGFVCAANASVLLPFGGNEVREGEPTEAQEQFDLACELEKQRRADYPTIVLWLRRAALQDHLEAQYALGKIYHFGKPGVPLDLQQAEMWYEKAAAKGDKQALYALNILRNQPAYRIKSAPNMDEKWEMQWIAKTASYGDMQSQFDLARLYAEGKKIQMDYEQAAKWYEKAALQGHIEAMFALATLYLEGKGVAADVNKALFWYEQAALRDYIPAQRKLYEIYSDGVDRVPNLVKAAGWLYVATAFLFPDEKDLLQFSPQLEDLWKQMSEEEKEQALYFAYSFIDEKRVPHE